MINKSDFIEAINVLKNYLAFYDKLNSLCRDFNRQDNFFGSEELFDLTVSLLKENIDDENDYISWWIFDEDFGECENSWVEFEDGKRIYLNNASDLYDFLISLKE